MSEFPDELGWIEFPGSERAAWATSSPPSAGGGAPAPAGALPADQPKPVVGTTGSRRPSQSIELGSAAQGPMAATAPQTAAIPPRRRYPGEDIEE